MSPNHEARLADRAYCLIRVFLYTDPSKELCQDTKFMLKSYCLCGYAEDVVSIEVFCQNFHGPAKSLQVVLLIYHHQDTVPDHCVYHQINYRGAERFALCHPPMALKGIPKLSSIPCNHGGTIPVLS